LQLKGRRADLPSLEIHHAGDSMALMNHAVEFVGGRHERAERHPVEHLEQRGGVLLDQVGTGQPQVRDGPQGRFVDQGVLPRPSARMHSTRRACSTP